MNEAFIRQRRNLLLTSIIVFLINFAGIEIGEQTTIFGTRFTVNNPIVIYISSWIILFYFLLRYIQYYNELDFDDKDYELYHYPWNDYLSSNLKKPIALIWTTIKYIFENIVGLFPFFWSSIFRKNFTETFFPILFAIFVILTSFYSPHSQEKKALAIEKTKEFTNIIIDKTYGNIIIFFNKKINILKEILNDYSYSLTNKELFDSLKDNKTLERNSLP